MLTAVRSELYTGKLEILWHLVRNWPGAYRVVMFRALQSTNDLFSYLFFIFGKTLRVKWLSVHQYLGESAHFKDKDHSEAH